MLAVLRIALEVKKWVNVPSSESMVDGRSVLG